MLRRNTETTPAAQRTPTSVRMAEMMRYDFTDIDENCSQFISNQAFEHNTCVTSLRNQFRLESTSIKRKKMQKPPSVPEDLYHVSTAEQN